jgi:ABC-type glycerol-3-phosphate transport system substrate-binding protein
MIRSKRATYPRRAIIAGLAAAPVAGLARPAAAAQTLTVWHDLGEPGNKWFAAAGKAFAESHPGVEVRAISYPTDQWFGRVIGAINTGTAPDLIFNNYERVIRIQAQTDKVMDMNPVLAAIADKGFLSEEDLRVATYDKRMIILPVQRVLMAFGARRSWLAKIGHSFPVTWKDAHAVAEAFQAGDPAGTGKGSVFGFALEAAHPRDLIHMLDLFTFGSGVRHTLLDPAGNITIDEPRHAAILEAFLRIFTTDRLVAPDTINYSFNEMYQVIEAGRAGMFRVGDWNAGKWDKQAVNGDYDVGPWPQFFSDLKSGVVIGGMRGVAVPENSPNKDLAIAFASSLIAKPAQQAALELVGDAVRKDLDTSALTPHQKQFATSSWNLIAYDFPESIHPWYPELEARFHKALLAGIAHPPADWQAFIRKTAADMRAQAKTLVSAAQKG